MRYLPLVPALLGVLPAMRGDPPASTAALRVANSLPGYELRVLDQQKRVRFQVGGSRVEVSVPLFVYCPAAGGSPPARLVREAQASLLRLATKPEWTASELQQVIAGLDQAAHLLEGSAPPGKPVTAAGD
jgi:hypothetical protein